VCRACACAVVGEEKREDIRLTYQGPTLWEAIVRLAVKTPKKAPKKPFRMSVVKMWNTTLVPGVRRTRYTTHTTRR
jgi:translation elongation factor EF-1alpha